MISLLDLELCHLPTIRGHKYRVALIGEKTRRAGKRSTSRLLDLAVADGTQLSCVPGWRATVGQAPAPP